MPGFGTGPEFASQCPHVPPPDGWRAWSDGDGPVPDILAERAKNLAENTAIPLGSTQSFPLAGTTALIRLEPRTWVRSDQGQLIQGCFRAGGIYLPIYTAEKITPPTTDKLTKAVNVLTVISLAIGTVATLAALGRRKK